MLSTIVLRATATVPVAAERPLPEPRSLQFPLIVLSVIVPPAEYTPAPSDHEHVSMYPGPPTGYAGTLHPSGNTVSVYPCASSALTIQFWKRMILTAASRQRPDAGAVAR